MSSNPNIDRLLEEKILALEELHKKIKMLKEKSNSLSAHKYTLVSMLRERKISAHYPIYPSISNGSIKYPIKVEGDHPFFILNIGSSKLDSKAFFPSHSYLTNYKIMRPYKRNIKSNLQRDVILYSTTVFINNGFPFYMIQDEENNVWKGPNAFEEFSKYFSCELPFKNIEEWLGLDNEAVKKLLDKQ